MSTHDDLSVLDALQRELPLVERPFAAAAHGLGLTEEAVLAVLARARDQGTLVRVGPVFRPGRIGASTLAAMAVPRARLDEVAALVSSFHEVNHNYERDHPVWNLWFVVTAPDAVRVRAVLDEIATRSGLEVLDLPLVREHHIDLGFPLSGPLSVARAARLRRDDTPAVDVARPALADRVIAAVQDGIALVPRPFEELARRHDLDEGEVLATLRALCARGDVRRFGAVVRHRALGFTHNAMCVFQVDAGAADVAGERLAELPCVTLCYQRRAAPPRWPYSLYCMIHGTSTEAVRADAEAAARAAGLADAPREILFSTRCFTQRGARYRATPNARSAARASDTAELDDVDRRLLNLLQDGIPIEDHPFRGAAAALGLEEHEVVRRIGALLERRALSRFGPMFDVERFGGHFTLVAMQVPQARFDEVTALVNAYPEVAHNYARDHALNMWFVLATESVARAHEVLHDIEERTGLSTLDLPRERTYHLGLRLAL